MKSYVDWQPEKTKIISKTNPTNGLTNNNIQNTRFSIESNYFETQYY